MTRSTGATATAIIIAIVGLGLIGYFIGRGRASAVVGGNLRRLHSLPNYHGFYVALWCGLPALLLSMAWLAAQPAIITQATIAALPAERVAPLDENQLSLLLSEVRQAANYADLSQVGDEAVRIGAETYRAWNATANVGVLAGAIALALLGIGIGPTLVTLYSLGAARSPLGRSATVMTMLGSGVVVGQSAAAAVTGALAESAGTGPALLMPLVSAAIVVIAGVVNRILSPRLH
jgi:hypothetical protein